jgi:hypothetical protein
MLKNIIRKWLNIRWYTDDLKKHMYFLMNEMNDDIEELQKQIEILQYHNKLSLEENILYDECPKCRKLTLLIKSYGAECMNCEYNVIY